MFKLAQFVRRRDAQPEESTDQQAALHGVTKESLIDALKTVFDPEIPVNIFDLGLIYSFDIDAHKGVHIRMTLTAPACPVADILPLQVKKAVLEATDASRVEVELVWDPPWGVERMSEEARLQLGL